MAMAQLTMNYAGSKWMAPAQKVVDRNGLDGGGSDDGGRCILGCLWPVHRLGRPGSALNDDGCR